MNKFTYIVKHKDNVVRLRSRSGGFFSALAQQQLQNAAVVYGCAQNEAFLAEHIRVTDSVDLPKLAGSKYVQSDLKDTFREVENDLKSGINVLYSGTACQISGLLRFLCVKNVDTQNLLTVDIVCHGVPSPEIWKAFLQWLERKKNGKIEAVDFRDKRYGWSSHFETVVINNNRTTMDICKNFYYKFYTIRPACYECPYCNIDRNSDITIADAWGVDVSSSDFNDDKGCSLVIINTEQGKMAFDMITKDIEFREVDLKQYMQPNLKNPSKCPDDRNEFWDSYKENGFEYVARKYGENTVVGNIKSKSKMLLGRIGLTRIVKKVLKR